MTKIADRSRLVKPEAKSVTRPKPSYDMDIRPAAPKVVAVKVPQVPLIKPQPFAVPAKPRQEASKVLKRQFEKPIVAASSLTAQSKPKFRRQRSRIQLALVGMAFLVFGLGLIVNLQTIQTNHDAKNQVAAFSQRQDDSGTRPSEAKPVKGSYVVAPNLPKYLKIDKLGVNARVVALGVTTQNQLKAPTNIYDAGWYDASAHPGDAANNGAILIDGHVHGPTLPGVFAGLKNLTAGDDIQIVRGDDQTFKYEVVKVQNYDAESMDMSAALTSIEPGKAALNLITCGGRYDKKSGEYDQRTMVFAVEKN